MFFRKRLKKPDPEAESRLRKQIADEGGLEPKDMPAMILAAILTIMPVILAVLGIFCLIAWWFVS